MALEVALVPVRLLLAWLRVQVRAAAQVAVGGRQVWVPGGDGARLRDLQPVEEEQPLATALTRQRAAWRRRQALEPASLTIRMMLETAVDSRMAQLARFPSVVAACETAG